jgi:hypothetical protein
MTNEKQLVTGGAAGGWSGSVGGLNDLTQGVAQRCVCLELRSLPSTGITRL